MNTLPFDILNKVLIYYMEPLDRANLGVVNKFNNSNNFFALTIIKVLLWER